MIVLGHRGGRGPGWPSENTLEAFARALAEGADGVELDVRVCATGEPVVLHDPTFAYVTDGRDRRRVDRVTLGELPRLAGGERIPTLAEALDACVGSIVNVEIKADVPSRRAAVRATAEAIGRARRGAEIVVSSFDPSIVAASAIALPRVPRAILVGPRVPRATTALVAAMRPLVEAAHLADVLATSERVNRLARLGLRVVAWTVNDRARAAALVASGVSWIISDDPSEVRPDGVAAR